jgi:SAM-dependent methyltransferase
MSRKMRRSKRRAKEFWRGASQEARYEYLVDSPMASPEIRAFHDDEESVLLNLLQQYVDREQNVAFIEIGCGPGRIIRRIAGNIVKQPKTWGRYVRYVVGVDFEIRMIERSIESLIKKERIVRDWVSVGTAHELSQLTDQSPASVKTIFREQVAFVDADAELPFLRCKSITPIVGLMFGTLGNIQRTKSILRCVSKLCGSNGKALIVVFKKENHPVGLERYTSLANRDFEPLKKTEWKEEGGYFTSPKGFYSRWFSADELRDLLKPYFARGFKVKELGRNGLYAILSPKSSISRITIRDAFYSRTEKPHLHLLCPVCGTELQGGVLPLQSSSDLLCPRKGCRFKVRNIMDFMVPILETENNCSNHKDA